MGWGRWKGTREEQHKWKLKQITFWDWPSLPTTKPYQFPTSLCSSPESMYRPIYMRKLWFLKHAVHGLVLSRLAINFQCLFYPCLLLTPIVSNSHISLGRQGSRGMRVGKRFGRAQVHSLEFTKFPNCCSDVPFNSYRRAVSVQFRTIRAHQPYGNLILQAVEYLGLNPAKHLGTCLAIDFNGTVQWDY